MATMELTSKILPQRTEYSWPSDIFLEKFENYNWVIDNGTSMEIRNTGEKDICFLTLLLTFKNKIIWDMSDDKNCSEFWFLAKHSSRKEQACAIKFGNSLKVDLVENSRFLGDF